MSWSTAQKRLAGQAFRESGISEDARQLFLRQLNGRAGQGDRLSTTAPGLTNEDFERYMAFLEQQAPKPLLGKPWGYWSRGREEGAWKRCLWRAEQEAAAVAKVHGEPYVRGIVSKAAKTRPAAELHDLDTAQLRQAIDALHRVRTRQPTEATA